MPNPSTGCHPYCGIDHEQLDISGHVFFAGVDRSEYLAGEPEKAIRTEGAEEHADRYD